MNAPTPIISIRNLCKSYGRKQVLKDINLDIYPGQVIGYIGPNGAGKSTTVKILCGMISDYTGTVSVKGLDLKTETLSIKKLIGYVPEQAELYEVLTPREFLSLVGALYDLSEETSHTRMQRILAALGLESNLDQRMDTFSKGMKQKILIAAGLLHNPEIIILDEPLTGLDANSVLVIKELLQRLISQGKTIFYCSHMMDIVEKVSGRIVLIHQGSIVADGTLDELRAKLGAESLEMIFAGLTADPGQSGAASEILDALIH